MGQRRQSDSKGAPSGATVTRRAPLFPNTQEKRGRGRPRLPIPEDKVLTLARLGMSNLDIAHFFECDEGTIRKRFGPQIVKAYAERHAKLREKQWQRAMEGSDTMLIWLGKNCLGQTDKQETDNRHTLIEVKFEEESNCKTEGGEG